MSPQIPALQLRNRTQIFQQSWGHIRPECRRAANRQAKCCTWNRPIRQFRHRTNWYVEKPCGVWGDLEGLQFCKLGSGEGATWGRELLLEGGSEVVVVATFLPGGDRPFNSGDGGESFAEVSVL